MWCRRLLSAFVERVKITFILLQIYFADKKLHNSFAPSLANILQISCLSLSSKQKHALLSTSSIFQKFISHLKGSETKHWWVGNVCLINVIFWLSMHPTYYKTSSVGSMVWTLNRKNDRATDKNFQSQIKLTSTRKTPLMSFWQKKRLLFNGGDKTFTKP